VTRPTDIANILLHAVDYWYGDLFNDAYWLVIDDYFGPAKAAPLRTELDALVSERRRVPFGYCGWGTSVGQWRRK
jgi:hypothetical protein